jgi:signal transduction histidine kinase
MTGTPKSRPFWRYVRGLLGPVLVWGLFIIPLVNTLQYRLQGDEEYDKAALKEWIEESRVFRATLPDLVRKYLEETDPASREGKTEPTEFEEDTRSTRLQEIHDQLRALVNPTRVYGAQLPLFPTIYRLELDFPVVARSGDPATSGTPLAPIIWESGIPRPRQNRQVQVLEHSLLGPADPRAVLRFEYQLHAYNKRQRDEQAAALRLRWVTVLAAIATAVAILWIYLVHHREREADRRRLKAQQQIDQAERLALANELRRQEAERKHEETERKLLEQQLATQAAERQALELKSHLYASIGIMAGSYAHNIKNLLVRPNDLLRRCLEADGLSTEQDFMLHEVRQTLGTVTERLQQILETVRRDPSRSELTRLDLNAIVGDIGRHWEELAREKWKLTLTVDLHTEPLWIEGDVSHLQQAIENLLFNARDATFEMRSRLREEARNHGTGARAQDSGIRSHGSGTEPIRQALIAAAAWKGIVMLRTRRQDSWAVLEVQDNGIGMTEEVRKRCTETHFSTKRNNAIYEGNTTGMGLGLSFVSVILEHHRAEWAIESQPLCGALFRIRLPLALDDGATG